MDIIRKTQSLSNLPSLTEAELGQRSLDWYEHLFGFIPMSRLVEMFNLAVRSHTGKFAINAFDIVKAWNETSAVERTESTFGHSDCPKCQGTGMETLYDEKGFSKGARKCQH